MSAASCTQLPRRFVLTVRSAAASTRLSLVTRQKLGGRRGAIARSACPSHAPFAASDPVSRGAHALALGASAVTQPWRTCSPPGFAVGTGAAGVPEPGPAGTVVVVVVDGVVVVVLAGTVVVVVLGVVGEPGVDGGVGAPGAAAGVGF